jgi:hypothetical protein
VDWEGSDKYCLTSLVKSSVYTSRCKTTRKTTTQSIITLVNTENTEEVNNNNEPIGRSVKTVNLTSYYPITHKLSSNNSVVDAIPFAVNSNNHRYNGRTSINVIGAGYTNLQWRLIDNGDHKSMQNT